MKKYDIPSALQTLRPDAQWVLRGDELSGLEWLDTVHQCPTEQEINDEIARLQAEWDAVEYQRQRAKEYPDFKEYLDGIVKGDQAQIQAYIDACQAVKDKYPKG